MEMLLGPRNEVMACRIPDALLPDGKQDTAEVSKNRWTQADSGIKEMERRRPVLGGAAEAAVTEELSFLSKLSAGRGPF